MQCSVLQSNVHTWKSCIFPTLILSAYMEENVRIVSCCVRGAPDRNLPRPLGRWWWLFQSPPKRQDDWTPSFALQPFHISEPQPCIIPSRFSFHLKMEIGSSSFSKVETFGHIDLLLPNNLWQQKLLWAFQIERLISINGKLWNHLFIWYWSPHNPYYLLSDRTGSVATVLMKKLHEGGSREGVGGVSGEGNEEPTQGPAVTMLKTNFPTLPITQHFNPFWE